MAKFALYKIMPQVEKASTEAIQAGADWVAEKLRELVGDPCDGTHHSAMGEAPKKESGAGQASIKSHHTAKGGQIRLDAIVERLGENGNNYMLYHDSHGRPWLSRWRELYYEDFLEIVRRWMYRGVHM